MQPELPIFATRRELATQCGWCKEEIELKPTGRIPKWCSATCRQRAWEQKRAAASGRCAVEVVERIVQVPVEVRRMPRHDEWSAVLAELVAQLETRRIYDRELAELGDVLAKVLVTFRRRRGVS
jgi:hypothetical protein